MFGLAIGDPSLAGPFFLGEGGGVAGFILLFLETRIGGRDALQMSHRFNHDRRCHVLGWDIAWVFERRLQFLTHGCAFFLACVSLSSLPSPFGKWSAWIERGWRRH